MESSLSAYHDPYPLLRSNPKLHVRTAKVRTAFYFPQSSSLYGSGLKLANERYLHEVGKGPFFFPEKMQSDVRTDVRPRIFLGSSRTTRFSTENLSVDGNFVEMPKNSGSFQVRT